MDDDLPVVNFDSVKECYCKKVNRWMQLPRSADALYCDRETLYLVEFKNGSLKETLGKRLNPKDDEELGINLGQRDALIEKCKDSVLSARTCGERGRDGFASTASLFWYTTRTRTRPR